METAAGQSCRLYTSCGKDWEPFHAAEFSLSEDEAGEAPFFHFDFHNRSALHQTIRDGEFVAVSYTHLDVYKRQPLEHM